MKLVSGKHAENSLLDDDSKVRMLYHITSAVAAKAAVQSGEYVPEAYAREGFIHCSYSHQLSGVAERFFRGQTNLVVLEIDPQLLNCRVVDENLVGGTELFPHVYGKLKMSAVVRIRSFGQQSESPH